ncbi:MAG: carbamoyltransferase C-terminal domain-containing protein [Acidobacteriota bacterium]|nr:carbamoyltransferase C-terminal domain-containing protein [Acidobacteriota bacterium]
MASILSLHTRHDANVTVSVDDQVRLILECERLFGQRYFAYSREPEEFRVQLDRTLETVGRLTGVESFDFCIGNWIPEEHQPVIQEHVPARRFVETTHHRAHAAGTYALSPFDECLIVSIDGGGNDGWINLYQGSKGRVRLLKRIDTNLGGCYRFLGNFIAEIRSRKAFQFTFGLDIAGKLMGLAAYGRRDEKLLAAIRKAMRSFQHPTDLEAFAREAGIPFEVDCLEGQAGRDLACNVQLAMEELMEEVFRENRDLLETRNVCLTGGCALNVLSNSNLARKYPDYNFYVPPNSNDCGIALGSLCDLFPQTRVEECAWDGVPLLDEAGAGAFREKFSHRATNPAEMARLLANGRIIGVVQGKSEHGPRALGNRSILALPGYPGIKDTLNQKVKFREPYRPFAPVVAVEQVDRYFDLPADSPYMSFSADVRPEHREALAGITHADGSSRVQTLRREHNPLVYEILDELAALGHPAVLLNTSLNIKGKPIVSRLSEAAEILETTELDLVYYDGALFENPAAREEREAVVAGERGG